MRTTRALSLIAFFALAASASTVSMADVARSILHAGALGDSLFIDGVNFDTRTPPTVVLGGIVLVVDSYSATEIVAKLPPNLPPATYSVCVSNKKPPALDPTDCKDQLYFDVAVGVGGAQGPQGPQGPQGAQGIQGPPGPGAIHSTQLYAITSAKCAGATTAVLVTTTSSCAYKQCSGSANVNPVCDAGCVQTGPATVVQNCTPFGCTNVDKCAPCACTNNPIGFSVQ